MSNTNGDVVATRWLLLIHQIPPKPDYLRVKIGRRLLRIGAVPVKNSVYVLPDRASSLEDFQWVRAEITDGGGDASICKAGFIDGLTDAQIEYLFRGARDADYVEIADAARELWNTLHRRDGAAVRQRSARHDDDLARLRKRFNAVVSIDFFDGAGRTMAEEALRKVAEELAQTGEVAPDVAAHSTAVADRNAYRGRTWVTRRGIFVDRIASAWLIRRFIDRDARFKFVADDRRKPAEDELRFDMFGGEFTHEGDRCTFETLLRRFHLEDPGLSEIAEIVHDIDLKDDKFARDDASGIERVLAGIASASADDVVRLERASPIFDDLYALFTAQHR